MGNHAALISENREMLRLRVQPRRASIPRAGSCPHEFCRIGGPPFALPVRHFELDCLTSKKGQLKYFGSEGRVPEHPPSTLQFVVGGLLSVSRFSGPLRILWTTWPHRTSILIGWRAADTLPPVLLVTANEEQAHCEYDRSNG